jgi:hypothetical protein
MVKIAIAAAGISGMISPKLIALALSRTMPPQSAAGGWMPRPRNESELKNRNAKQNRSPNSAISGGSVLGRTSRNTIQGSRSPRSRATSTKSMTAMSIATARESRKTRVESRSAMTTTSVTTEGGRTERTTSAKISVGIAISVSTAREMARSAQPPTTAAT